MSTFTAPFARSCPTSDTTTRGHQRSALASTSATFAQALLGWVSPALSLVDEVAVNEPFRRTQLAIHHLGRDNKATSVMLEPLRDLPTGGRGAWISKLTAGSVRLVAIPEA